MKGMPLVKSNVNIRAGTKPYVEKSLFTATGGRLTEYKNTNVQVIIKLMVINGRRRLGIVSLNGITPNHPLLSYPPVRIFHVSQTHRSFIPRGCRRKLAGAAFLPNPPGRGVFVSHQAAQAFGPTQREPAGFNKYPPVAGQPLFIQEQSFTP